MAIRVREAGAMTGLVAGGEQGDWLAAATAMGASTARRDARSLQGLLVDRMAKFEDERMGKW